MVSEGFMLFLLSESTLQDEMASMMVDQEVL